MKRRICIVITARPSYSRIKTVLDAVQDHQALELQVIVAASALLDRYGSIVEFIENDGIPITAKIYNVLEGEDLTAAAKTTGIGILELSTVFDNLRPDIVITVADRFETIATAIASSYMNIPLGHIQGGEVTGNIDEKVRHAITKLADYHFVSTSQAKKRVERLGENPDFVFNTGCPSIDLAKQISRSQNLDFDPATKYQGVGDNIDPSWPFLVVMQHPVTTHYNDARKHIEETLSAIAQLGMPAYWFWPNIDAGADGTSKGIRAFREYKEPKNIRFFKNMEPLDFLKLIKRCACLVGNSSVGIRESSFIGVPVVNIGDRQRGRERAGNVIDVGYDRKSIVSAIKKHLRNGKFEPSDIYGKGKAGKQVADLLAKVPLRIDKILPY